MKRLFLVLSLLYRRHLGLMVVCFRVAITGPGSLPGILTPSGPFRVLVVTDGVGLLVAVSVHLVFFFPGARGSGQQTTRFNIYNGYNPFRTVLGKFIPAALSIVGGFSLAGTEDRRCAIERLLASMVRPPPALSQRASAQCLPGPDRVRGPACPPARVNNAAIISIRHSSRRSFRLEESVDDGARRSGFDRAVRHFHPVWSFAPLFWGAEPMFLSPVVTDAEGPPQELLAYPVLGVRRWCRVPAFFQMHLITPGLVSHPSLDLL